MIFLKLYHYFNRMEYDKVANAIKQVPVKEWPRDESMSGATGLKGNISQLLHWGVAHLPDQIVGGKVLREAIEMTGQVLVMYCKMPKVCYTIYSLSSSATTHKTGQE